MFFKKNKKVLAFPKTILYNADVVTLIAMKREVAVQIDKCNRFSVERMSS